MSDWAVAAAPVSVAVFVGLFVLDVYRTKRNPDAPMRMLSEVAFNVAMNGSMVLLALASVRSFWSLLVSLSDIDWRMAVAAAVTGVGCVWGLITSGQRGAELPTAPIPDFLRCDGEFVAVKEVGNARRGEGGDGAVRLDSWFGWLRFEGHGACRIQRSAESVEYITCEWRVHAENVIQVVLPQPPPACAGGATELYVSGGEVSLTDASLSESINVSLTVDGAPVCRLSFVPEEHANES